jgi:hypothetical protein
VTRDVLHFLTGVSLKARAPYTVSIPLDLIVGTKGIEVIGATRRVQHEMPPE